MLQTSFPGSIEDALFCVSDHGKKDFLCDRVPSGETWQVCMTCNKVSHNWCRKVEPMQQDRGIDDDPCSSNCPSSISQPSTASTMTENNAPNLVYRRKRLRKNSTAPLLNGSMELQRNANCHSVMSSCAHLSSAQDLPIATQVEHEIETVKNSVVTAVFCVREPYVSKLDSNDQCLLEKGHDGDGSTKNSMQKNLGFDSVNDSCSSSKSNMELVSDSIEAEIDETCECSSSSVIVTDVMKDISEKDFCINFLRSNGLLKGDFHANKASVGDAFTAGDNCCCRSCKICDRLDRSLNLLICDNCEEAYHPSCYIPRMKKLPIDEWFCHSCLRKKRKILKEIVIRSPIIKSEMGSSAAASVKDELNPILLMLKDTDMYSTSVRVGKGFQAEVPDWSGPIRSDDDDDDLAEPLVFDTSELSGLQEGNLRKPTRCSSIANWLQCRAIINRTNGTLCGKWRRAPLFEVQTDEWECFCAIHWDPAHADCAVPQEMDTEQVLKQLKYIEMLRPRLATRQRKSDCIKGNE